MAATFLCCMTGEADTGTSGCVCVKIAGECTEKPVRSADAETRPVIVSDISQDKE